MRTLDFDNLAWCQINGTLIFLDIINDRYFQLTEVENRAVIDGLKQSGIAEWHQPTWLPKPQDLKNVQRASARIEDGSFNLAEVARALWVQRRVERRLASIGFASTLRHLSDILARRSCQLPVSSIGACRTISAFDQSRLIRSAADRCLARSIALAICLAARGFRAEVFIGVKLAPFGAHCWVQAGEEILNESVEEALRYKIILAI